MPCSICLALHRMNSNFLKNVLIMGEFSIDMKSKSLGYDQLDEFCDKFNITNLIKSETCFTKNHKSF